METEDTFKTKMDEIEKMLKEKGVAKFFGHIELEDGSFCAYEFGGMSLFDRVGVGHYLHESAKSQMAQHFRVKK